MVVGNEVKNIFLLPFGILYFTDCEEKVAVKHTGIFIFVIFLCKLR